MNDNEGTKRTHGTRGSTQRSGTGEGGSRRSGGSGSISRTKSPNDDDKRRLSTQTSKMTKSKISEASYRHVNDHNDACVCCTCSNRWEFDSYYDLWFNAYYAEWYSEYYNQYYLTIEHYYEDPWSYVGGKGGKGKKSKSKSKKSSKKSSSSGKGKGKGGSGSRSSGSDHYPGGGSGGGGGGGGGGYHHDPYYRGVGGNRCDEDFHPPGHKPGSELKMYKLAPCLPANFLKLTLSFLFNFFHFMIFVF